MENIKGKVALVTGAGSGIGRSIAIELAKQGVRVVLAGRSADALQQVAKEIEKTGGEVVYRTTDVVNKAEMIQVVNLAMESFGQLDVLVNNAGVAHISRVEELDTEGWDEMVDINVKGVLNGIAAALPVFKKQQSGHIVNIISTAGLKIVPGQAVYAATKNAVRTFAEAFRQESDGTIRITGISPGYVNTGFAGKSVQSPENKAAASKLASEMGISPDAVANAVIYAISQPADVEIGDIVIRPSVQN